LAVKMATESGLPVTFIATATPTDDDMAARIARHRTDRPADWTLIEEPLDVARSLSTVEAGACVVVDCLTLWISNLMLEERSQEQIEELALSTAEVAARRSEPTIVVTNEVGSSLHSTNELGRRFVDTTGRVNQIWGDAADEAYLVVAGGRVRLC